MPELICDRPPTDADARWREHERNTELLDAELPDRRFRDPTYLRWLYDENPYGSALWADVDDEDGRRVAHYALVPQEYRGPDGPVRTYFSLNAVTRSGAQRRGYFSELGLRLWPQAGDDGAEAVIGVMNARSITPVTRLGWHITGPLPVVALPALWGSTRGVTSHAVTPALLDSPEFERLVAGIDEVRVDGLLDRATPTYLRWRLSAPNSGPFALHVADDLVAVSTVHHVARVPVAVLLKLAVRGTPSRRVPARGVVAAACRFHHAPAAVYAGWNRFVKLEGARPPDRVKPSPLIMGVCNVGDHVDGRVYRYDAYEFLDMDAY